MHYIYIYNIAVVYIYDEIEKWLSLCTVYQTWGQFNFGIGIDYLKKMNWNWEIGIEVSYKKLNPEINLPFLQC